MHVLNISLEKEHFALFLYSQARQMELVVLQESYQSL